MPPRSDDARTEPVTATPSDVPSWRLAELMPDATLARDFGTADMMPLVTDALASPNPAPNTL
jgi:hypothetical protein